MLKIKFFPPLDKIVTPVRELNVPGPISVAEVLQVLREETPDFTPYAGFNRGDTHPRGLLVWRNRKLLTLDDILNPDDEVEMIAMVTGG